MDVHDGPIDRNRDGDAHLLVLRVDDEVGIDDVVETVHGEHARHAFRPKPFGKRCAIADRHRIGILVRQHALVVDIVHEDVTAGEPVKLDAFPFG